MWSGKTPGGYQVEIPLGTPLKGNTFTLGQQLPQVERIVMHVHMVDGSEWKYEVNHPYLATLGMHLSDLPYDHVFDVNPLVIAKPPETQLTFTFQGTGMPGSSFFTISEEQSKLP